MQSELLYHGSGITSINREIENTEMGIGKTATTEENYAVELAIREGPLGGCKVSLQTSHIYCTCSIVFGILCVSACLHEVCPDASCTTHICYVSYVL